MGGLCADYHSEYVDGSTIKYLTFTNPSLNDVRLTFHGDDDMFRAAELYQIVGYVDEEEEE